MAPQLAGREVTDIATELAHYGLDRLEELPEGGWGAGRKVDDQLMLELDSAEAILAYVRTLPPVITDGWKTSAPRTKKGKH
jgi:hypothetical protein